MSPRRDAAILLIGNEILSGRIRDENLHYLASELWHLGVPVRRACLVRDDVEEIAAELRELVGRYSYVFTSGGIGPTHDDVTIDAVARAFGVPVVVHPRLESLLRSRLGERMSGTHLRMARVPQGAILEAAEETAWPTVRMHNAFILPGVPSILRRKFELLGERFRQDPFHRRMLALQASESGIADILDRVDRRFGDVDIGSYPQSGMQKGIVLVTVESPDAERTDEAFAALEEATRGIPRG